ncbi:hypothetical protein [Cuniculiplasma divulgatum]|uniref:hypothetical protein n=1 Tax=Cuniculiplasma divulgatum TaxID=1673428 RepID=UPI0011E59CD7|nr:hypothetical protein [Cuniculiplasma divulgatum]
MSDNSLLDWKLRLSFSPETELTNGARKYSITSEMGIYVDGEKTEISIFFPDDLNMNRELFIFLNSMNAVNKNGIWRISREMEVSKDFRKLMQGLVGAQSAVLSSAWIDKGIFKVEIIFSKNRLEKISSILLKNMDQTSDVAIEYLGPSGGMKKSLEDLSNRSNVSVIEYDFTLDQTKFADRIDALGNSWFRIIKSPYESRTVSAVYIIRDGQKVGSRLNEIIKGRLYEVEIHNPIFTEINNKIRKERIPVLLKMQSLDNGVMRYFIIHPSIFTLELLGILRETGLMEMGLNPVIRRVQPIQEWLNSSSILQEVDF